MAQTKVKLISDGVIVQGNLHASHGITTAHIGEGSNLYYTDARVGSYLSSNGYATQSTIVAAITDSAPSTLDTLNELAAALGDDANFSTTVTNNIATKMPLAGGTFTGNVGFNDSTTLSLGASGDLFLIHDATNSIIGNSAGNLIIRNDADDGDIIFQSDNGSGGRDNYLTIDGGVERIFVHKLMRFDDDVQLRLGNNNDIRLYHNSTTGNNNFENHTGGLYVTQYVDDGNIIFRSDDGSGGVAEYIIVNGGAGSVQLKHYGNTKFQTTSTGVEVVTTGINQSSTIRIQGTDGNGNGHPLDLKMNGADDSFSILIGQGGGATPSTVLFNGNRNGNVGIGTTSPSAKLEVRGTAPTYTNSSTVFWGGTTNNDSHNGIMLSSFGDALGGSLASNLLYSNSNTPTQTNTNRSSGQIKFGNTTVASKTSDINFGGYYKGTTTFVERMRINGDGNVGIGTTSPAAKLEISGIRENQIRLTSYDTSAAVDEIIGGVEFYSSDTGNEGVKASISAIAANTEGSAYMTFSTGTNTERMRIDTSGNVGIGTTSPASKLVVRTSTDHNFEVEETGGELRLSALNDARSANIGLQFAASEFNFITGNVGIGTTSPDITGFGWNALTIVGGTTAGSAGILELGAPSTDTNNQNYGIIAFMGGTGRNAQIAANRDSATNDGRLSFWTSPGSGGIVERMRITSAGNVGIGTTSPSNKLEVNGGIAITSSGNNRLRFYRGGFFKAGIQVPDTAGQMISGSGVNDLAIRTQSNLLFATGGSAERMRITSGGEVCIGTTSSAPSAQLTIALNDSVGGRLSLSNLRTALFDGDEFGRLSFVSNDATQTGDRARISALCRNTGAATDLLFYTGNTSAGVAERMRITSTGNILVGTTGTPNGTSVYGSAFIDGGSGLRQLFQASSTTTSVSIQRFYNPNGNVGSIQTNGSSTSYSTSSDYRLKENVVEMTGALDRVSQLKPSRFNFIADADKTVDGFLAHEVQEIVPEAITGEKDAVDEEGNPEYQGIDQSKLVPLLVGAIKELKAEIETLKTQING